MKWYKHDPDRFLSGTAELNLEETGAYIKLINIAYSRNGDLPDDDRFIRTHLRCHWHTWATIKQSLMVKKKLTIADGKIIPNGVIEGLYEANTYLVSKRYRAKKSTKSTKIAPTTTTTTTEEYASAYSSRAHARGNLKKSKSEKQQKWEDARAKVRQAHFAEVGGRPPDWDVPRRGDNNGSGIVSDRVNRTDVELSRLGARAVTKRG